MGRNKRTLKEWATEDENLEVVKKKVKLNDKECEKEFMWSCLSFGNKHELIGFMSI